MQRLRNYVLKTQVVAGGDRKEGKPRVCSNVGSSVDQLMRETTWAMTSLGLILVSWWLRLWDFISCLWDTRNESSYLGNCLAVEVIKMRSSLHLVCDADF